MPRDARRAPARLILVLAQKHRSPSTFIQRFDRFEPASSMASIACRMAGDASSNFNAVFMVQELSFDMSPSILELTPNRSFGVVSNTRHKS
jgi:hypothetical protein